jgi:hypothetical protein
MPACDACHSGRGYVSGGAAADWPDPRKETGEQEGEEEEAVVGKDMICAPFMTGWETRVGVVDEDAERETEEPLCNSPTKPLLCVKSKLGSSMPWWTGKPWW